MSLEYIINLPEINCFVIIYRNVIKTEEIFKVLERDCIVRHPITIFGKKLIQPRTNCLYANENIKEMKYSTATIQALPFPKVIEELKNTISISGFAPDSCLINGYLSELDNVGLHRDKNLKDGNDIVCTVSIGYSRKFRYVPYKKISCPIELKSYETILNNGDILYMYGATNTYFQHEILKYNKKDPYEFGPRYSATFRKIN